MLGHKSRIHERKGMVGMILILVALVVILIILVPAIKNGFKSIGLIKSYTTPKLDLKNNFEFTASNVYIGTGADSSCQSGVDTSVAHPTYDCQGGKNVTFQVEITNNGLKDRRFIPGIVICPAGTKDCCNSNKKVYYSNTDYCLIASGVAELPCDMNPYKLSNLGKAGTTADVKIEVHPIVECIKDEMFGCYDPGMTENVKSCNNDKYVILNVAGG